MKRRFVKAVLASIAAACVLSTAGARERAGAAAHRSAQGRPRGPRHLRLYREGRFEIAPTVSFTLLDEYRRTILVGARLNYNIRDWLAIGVWGAVGAISTRPT